MTMHLIKLVNDHLLLFLEPNVSTPLLNMASRKRTATTTTLTNFLVKPKTELGDNLAHVDCEDNTTEAIDNYLRRFTLPNIQSGVIITLVIQLVLQKELNND